MARLYIKLSVKAIEANTPFESNVGGIIVRFLHAYSAYVKDGEGSNMENMENKLQGLQLAGSLLQLHQFQKSTNAFEICEACAHLLQGIISDAPFPTWVIKRVASSLLSWRGRHPEHHLKLLHTINVEPGHESIVVNETLVLFRRSKSAELQRLQPSPEMSRCADLPVGKRVGTQGT